METIKAAVILAGLLAVGGLSYAQDNGVGVDEHLGRSIPLNAVFSDEAGTSVRLGDLIRRPTVLALVYLGCPNICGPLMHGMGEVFDAMGEVPGKDYDVIALSFNPREKPELAAQAKSKLLNGLRKPFPPAAWHFLTGTPENILAVTEAVGFHYKPQGDDFAHPTVLTVLSPKGVIVRYLYGIQFLPFDVEMALAEAQAGRIGPSIHTVLLYCYSYDPGARKYTFNILKVAGTATLAFLGMFVLYLVVSTQRSRRRP